MEVTDVHVRYEDHEGNFAFGMTLESMLSHTTDAQGQPVYVENPTQLFKQTHVRELRVYLQPNMPKSETGRGDEEIIVGDEAALVPPLHVQLMFMQHKATAEVKLTVTNQIDLGVTCTHQQLECLARMLYTVSTAQDTLEEQERARQQQLFRSGTGEERRRYILLYKRLLQAQKRRKH